MNNSSDRMSRVGRKARGEARDRLGIEDANDLIADVHQALDQRGEES